MANSIQVDALCQLLIEKGIVTGEDFCTKLKEDQEEYEARQERRAADQLKSSPS